MLTLEIYSILIVEIFELSEYDKTQGVKRSNQSVWLRIEPYVADLICISHTGIGHNIDTGTKYKQYFKKTKI